MRMMNLMRMFVTYANAADTGLDAALTETDPAATASAAGAAPPASRLAIHPARPRQHIDGFGASMTEASAWLFLNAMRDPDRILTELFSDTDGIGLSLLRQPIGPSDHVVRPYRFLRRRADPTLDSLDFSHEIRAILPPVGAAARLRARSQEALPAGQRTPLRVIASPWSAPANMKTNHSVLGRRPISRLIGRLKPSSHGAYAELIARFCALYRQYGVDIFAVTPVNEPDLAHSLWPTMAMSPAEQARFVARSLAPRLRAHGLGDVRILCWDHNYSTRHFPEGRFVREVYARPDALAALAGSAWHYYGGDVRTLDAIHRDWPDKGIWVTEASGGDWGPRNWDAALMTMGGAVCSMMQHWARCAILWNVALDGRHAPDWYYVRRQLRHAQNRGLVSVDRATGEVTRNADFYALAHFSRFVAPGSACVDSDLSDGRGMQAVAFRTERYGVVAVVVNERPEAAAVEVAVDGARPVRVTLPPRSLTTLTDC
ncbi:glucosylceramidase [Bifidobacterium cuniculi]|uniref:Glucosylceramidase n=3 Tax=Bifidobacterium cuniculi TaxID=1688 RepID=A0A087B584_9BIFI|nr:glucosylceramidase [Bifidobacterium cuniculi]